VEGIVHVLRCLLAEADLFMAVDGFRTRADLRPEIVQPIRA
jgi:lactate 2-monooxygenase